MVPGLAIRTPTKQAQNLRSLPAVLVLVLVLVLVPVLVQQSQGA